MQRENKMNFDTDEISSLLKQALAEDIGAGDVTSQLAGAEGKLAEALYIMKESAIVCGLPLVERLCRLHDEKLDVTLLKHDGDRADEGTHLVRVRGDAASILAVERVSLNFLQRLSGIAALTRRFVDAAAPHAAKIMDTRKTTPTLRSLEKYAVRTGGGENHRSGLYDQVLLKDNHLAVSSGETIRELVGAIRRKTKLTIEVEIDTLEQFEDALRAKPDIILLDNMSVDNMVQAVERLRKEKTTIALEASGGITLDNVAAIAATGVDRISIGALTHSARACNISVDIKLL